MRTIKLRYVKRNGTYYMERKTFFGWKRIGYTINMGYGSLWQSYTSDNKKDLLKEVLEKHYEVDKRFVTIKEYPTIKIY
jgi:hypothetical protein